MFDLKIKSVKLSKYLKGEINGNEKYKKYKRRKWQTTSIR